MIIRIIQARITIVAIKPIATSGFFETMRLIQFNEFNQTLLHKHRKEEIVKEGEAATLPLVFLELKTILRNNGLVK